MLNTVFNWSCFFTKYMYNTLLFVMQASSHCPKIDIRWTQDKGNVQIRIWSQKHRASREGILYHCMTTCCFVYFTQEFVHINIHFIPSFDLVTTLWPSWNASYRWYTQYDFVYMGRVPSHDLLYTLYLFRLLIGSWQSSGPSACKIQNSIFVWTSGVNFGTVWRGH